jgi:hypothetical protein
VAAAAPKSAPVAPSPVVSDDEMSDDEFLKMYEMNA